MSNNGQNVIDIRGPPENLPPLPALPDGVVAAADRQNKIMTPSASGARSPRHIPSSSTNSLETSKQKRTTKPRRRANSAATTRLAHHRSSYSLFPQPEKVKEITA